jgi:hypothetical protein
MTSPLYTCQGCGAQLSLAQLRGTDCPYCRAAFPHHARAVEQAAVVQQVMAQGFGLPAGAMGPMPAYGQSPPPMVYGSSVTYTHVAQLHAMPAQVEHAMRRSQRAIVIGVAASIALTFLGILVSALASG